MAKELKYYRILHYNDQGKYCTHANIMTRKNIEEVIKDYFTPNNRYYEITQDDFLRDKFYSGLQREY